MKNLDTIFAVEFGQLLENFLFSSADRDRHRKVICSCLGLKNENQLAQIFAGYDTPTTAGIFELIRTLNHPEFTERFFRLQTTNIGGTSNGINVATQADSNVPTTNSQPPISGSQPSRDREDTNPVRPDRVCDENHTEGNSDFDWGEEDFDPSFLDE